MIPVSSGEVKLSKMKFKCEQITALDRKEIMQHPGEISMMIALIHRMTGQPQKLVGMLKGKDFDIANAISMLFL